jgi:cytidylate kinase
MSKPFVIAVDGPSGAGKSTLSRRLARELGLLYIDTGAMYRAAALAVLEASVDAADEPSVVAVVKRSDIELRGAAASLRVLLDGRDVTDKIRVEELSRMSSVISVYPEVRRTLVSLQRKMGASAGAVLDGRDIGTVVFPNADVKFFLTASPEERAARRYEQQQAIPHGMTYNEILTDINTRDQRDSTRHDSPLAIADDAVVIDSTEQSTDEVFEHMMSVVRKRQQRGEA